MIIKKMKKVLIEVNLIGALIVEMKPIILVKIYLCLFAQKDVSVLLNILKNY